MECADVRLHQLVSTPLHSERSSKGPPIKDVCTHGEGGLAESGHMPTQGGGGSVSKNECPQIQIFTKTFGVLIVSSVLKINI